MMEGFSASALVGASITVSHYGNVIMYLLYFMLVLFRITGILVAGPFFGSKNTPMQIKIGLGVVITLTIFAVVPGLKNVEIPTQMDAGALLKAVAGEIAIGLIIGFVANLMFLGVQMAGQMIGQQMGFAMATVSDPFTQTEVPVLAQFLFFVFFMLFLQVGGHRLLMIAFLGTFEQIPITGFSLHPAPLVAIVKKAIMEGFVYMLVLGAPVIVMMLAVTIPIGLLNKVMPTFQPFHIIFSVKILGGLMVLILMLSLASKQIGTLTSTMMDHTFEVIEAIRKDPQHG